MAIAQMKQPAERDNLLSAEAKLEKLQKLLTELKGTGSPVEKQVLEVLGTETTTSLKQISDIMNQSKDFTEKNAEQSVLLCGSLLELEVNNGVIPSDTTFFLNDVEHNPHVSDVVKARAKNLREEISYKRFEATEEIYNYFKKQEYARRMLEDMRTASSEKA